MLEPVELTVEQQFEIRRIQMDADSMSPEALRQAGVFLAQQLMVRETMYKQILKNEWGICE